jgi:hypothetical protein
MKIVVEGCQVCPFYLYGDGAGGAFDDCCITDEVNNSVSAYAGRGISGSPSWCPLREESVEVSLKG